MIQINLLPKSEQKELVLEVAYNQLLLFWVWVILSLLVFSILAFGTKLYLNHKNSQIDAAIAENQNVLNSSDYKGLQDQIGAFNLSVSDITNLEAQHQDWSKVLVELTTLLPTSVQLNHLSVDRKTGEIDIAGQAETRADVIQVWSNIIKSDFFNGINFPLANLEKATVADFNFTFFVNKDKLTPDENSH